MRMAYLSICATFKDEAPYIPEWIEFHRRVGVEHFFLYDNLSTDGSREVLEPWVRAGLVTLSDCSTPFEQGGQSWAYTDALRRAHGHTRWLAFIDLDEFLFSPGGAPLPDVLKDYEQHPGPDGLVIESFLTRAMTQWVRNRRVKSIVDPARALRPIGPHFFEYMDGALAVTENHKPVRAIQRRAWTRRIRRSLSRLPLIQTDPYAVRDSSVKHVSVERLRLNHYAVRSQQEFEQKTARHGSSRMAPRYFAYHDRNEVHDPALIPYANQVRARLIAAESP